AALHLTMKSIGIKSGDEVILPSFTFVATANCVLYQGGKPIFVEINPETWNIDPQDIQEKINPKTKAIIVVHYAGQPVEMDEINELAKDHKLFVIEDAAHAAGAEYKNKKAGSLGDIGCFSFFSNKNMTTGEGGMLTTNNKEIERKLRLMRSHGFSRGHWERYGKKDSWKYDILELGHNYRMSEINAALGIEQLKKLDEMNKKRVENAKLLITLLKDIKSLKTQKIEEYAKHVFYIFPTLLDTHISRDDFIEKLRSRNIEAGVHYQPIHLFTLYKKLFGYKGGELPITEKISNQIFTLPMHQNLNKNTL
ncbi:MAG: DegT/DnrJ/EryC1/StrS family aminotransferase, partial [Methanosarcinales archaeon]